MSTRQSSGLEIAIIGMSGRFPGAANLEEFWANISRGVESVRVRSQGNPAPLGSDAAGNGRPARVPAVAMLDGADLFDAPFFDISPREAELLDPQHRLFLEECWSALECAGYGRVPAGVSVGVFGGCTINTYLLENLCSHPAIRDMDAVQLNVASSVDFLTTRVSYKLGLTGPSHVVQSACSTSLLAVHVGCRSLLDHECDIALAGAASVNVRLADGYLYVPGGILSPDGHCRPFDRRAQGTVFGSGVGVVVLKRLADAEADRDTIRAAIVGSAVNNDGAVKVGYSAPSVEGQGAVITEAIANAAIEARSVSMVEAHGTGTPLGDPAEVRALMNAFGSADGTAPWCALSSVKGNIGHLDAAAGVTGLIKTVLCLEHRTIPPLANFESPNPDLGIENSPFYVTAEPRSWTSGDGPRRAGVSSFGVGGTNVHLVVEEASLSSAATAADRENPTGSHLLCLSARTPTAARHAAANLATCLEHRPEIALGDVAYTLHVGRRPMAHRMSIVCSTSLDAVRQLRSAADPASAPHSVTEAPPLVFAFPAECSFDASPLYWQRPQFREHVDEVHRAVLAVAGASRVGSTATATAGLPWPGEASHPLRSFALQYALARMWMALGIRPSAVVGVGAGEFVASVIAGVVDLPGALAIAASCDAGSRDWHTMTGSGWRESGGFRSRLASPTIPLYREYGGRIDVWEEETAERWATRVASVIGTPAEAKFDVIPNAIVLSLGARERNHGASEIAGMPVDEAGMARAVGLLWLNGIEADASALYAGCDYRRIALPTYPFERQRYWIDPPAQGAGSPTAAPVKTLEPRPRPSLGQPFVRPRPGIEQRMASIWTDVLGIRGIGAEDNFFEMGGDSLLAVELAKRVAEQLDVRLPASDLYEFLTIRSLADYLSAHEDEQLRGDNPSITGGRTHR